MKRFSNGRGLGLIEWILIVILVIMVIITVYYLFEPALTNLWQQTLETIQE